MIKAPAPRNPLYFSTLRCMPLKQEFCPLSKQLKIACFCYSCLLRRAMLKGNLHISDSAMANRTDYCSCCKCAERYKQDGTLNFLNPSQDMPQDRFYNRSNEYYYMSGDGSRDNILTFDDNKLLSPDNYMYYGSDDYGQWDRYADEDREDRDPGADYPDDRDERTEYAFDEEKGEIITEKPNNKKNKKKEKPPKSKKSKMTGKSKKTTKKNVSFNEETMRENQDATTMTEPPEINIPTTERGDDMAATTQRGPQAHRTAATTTFAKTNKGGETTLLERTAAPQTTAVSGREKTMQSTNLQRRYETTRDDNSDFQSLWSGSRGDLTNQASSIGPQSVNRTRKLQSDDVDERSVRVNQQTTRLDTTDVSEDHTTLNSGDEDANFEDEDARKSAENELRDHETKPAAYGSFDSNPDSNPSDRGTLFDQREAVVGEEIEEPNAKAKKRAFQKYDKERRKLKQKFVKEVKKAKTDDQKVRASEKYALMTEKLKSNFIKKWGTLSTHTDLP